MTGKGKPPWGTPKVRLRKPFQGERGFTPYALFTEAVERWNLEKTVENFKGVVDAWYFIPKRSDTPCTEPSSSESKSHARPTAPSSPLRE